MRWLLILVLLIPVGCSGDDVPSGDCFCRGPVGTGTIDLLCGAAQCIGGSGYRCVDHGVVNDEPSVCGTADSSPPPDSGVPDTGSPLLPNCGVRAGTWSVTGTVRATSTRAGCSFTPIEVTAASVDQMSGIGTCNDAECSCADMPATEPGCIASWATSCDDGSRASNAFGRISNTSVFGVATVEPSPGSACEYDIELSFLR